MGILDNAAKNQEFKVNQRKIQAAADLGLAKVQANMDWRAMQNQINSNEMRDMTAGANIGLAGELDVGPVNLQGEYMQGVNDPGFNTASVQGSGNIGDLNLQGSHAVHSNPYGEPFVQDAIRAQHPIGDNASLALGWRDTNFAEPEYTADIDYRF